MIDVENIVVDNITRVVKSYYPNATIKSTKNDVPSSVPFVSVVEADNTTYRKTQDGDNQEHHVELMYEVNVYSNKKDGKKTEAKKIISLVDDVLQNMKFTRITKLPIEDKSYFRYVARYTVVVGYGLGMVLPSEILYPSEDLLPTDITYQAYRK